jgi:hypothetical protein
MSFKDLVWKIFYEDDNEFVLSKIDVDEKLDEQKKINVELMEATKELFNDLKNKDELIKFYVDEEEKEAKARELETYWNTKRPKTTWLYPGRHLYNDESSRIPVDPRIFFQTDRTIPGVSGSGNDVRANNCLKKVISTITYTRDVKSGGEYWQFPFETIRRKKGDCEDGAILMANMMINSGIPYWRIRLNAGMVQGGGHAYVTYLREEDNQWYVMDWCYWPSEAVDFKKTWNSAEKYFGIWGSWNKKYVFGDLPKE